MSSLNSIIDNLITGVINLTVICGCAYIVFWKDHSGWWFLMAFLLLHKPSKQTNP